MTSADRTNLRLERAGKILAAVASVWYAVAISWGLFARIGGGHETAIATRAIIAENMRVWHILGPVKDYVLERPGPELYYVHHPWGTFWTIAAFAGVLGRGTWVPRLVGVLLSAATPPLLYAIGRDLWGPIPGAVTALAYVVLPIALAFGNLPGFEVPVIVGCLLVTWGYLRFAQHWNRRWMLVSLAGVLVTANSDWEGVVFLGTILVCLAACGLGLPRWFGRVGLPQFAEWWILAALVSACSVLGYVAYFQHIGLLDELVRSEALRSRGDQSPLFGVLRVRSYWIDVTFTPLAVTLGKVALPVFVARFLFWRRTREVFPLAFLVMAVFEYVKFKNGADVHIFWPMPFAPYWALSLGVLSASAIDLARWQLARRERVDRGIAAFASLAVFGLVALAVLPDGIRGMVYARATAGRFNEKGRRIFNDVDLSQALEWMAQRMVPNTVVAMEREIAGRENRGQEWALHRPLRGVVPSAFFASREDRYYVGDLRFLNSADQRRAASEFRLVTVGPYFFIDRDTPRAPVEAYAFEEREPNFFEWYFAHPTEPMRTIRPDPWATWELRAHYGQSPNPRPEIAPRTLDEVRAAYNSAVDGGDSAGAEKRKAELLGSLDRSVTTTFPDGTQLLGERLVRGVDPKLELYFLAEGPLAADSIFEVVSQVDAAPPLSLVPADDKVKQYGDPFVIPPKLWRKGFIYQERVDLRFRPGTEYFAGYFEPMGAVAVAFARSPHESGTHLLTHP